jgi:hypothetical protein
MFVYKQHLRFQQKGRCRSDLFLGRFCNQPRLEDVALAKPNFVGLPVKRGVNCICNFFVSRFPFSIMVFNGKRETRNGMKLCTNILPGSAWLLGVTRPEVVDLNGINIIFLSTGYRLHPSRRHSYSSAIRPCSISISTLFLRRLKSRHERSAISRMLC